MTKDGACLQELIVQMTGQQAPCGYGGIASEALSRSAVLLNSELGLGFSQFNELLLHLGYDRVAHEFFQFLIDGSTEYSGGCIKPLSRLQEGIERFRKLALLRYGNVKFGFKNLGRDPEELEYLISKPIPSSKYEHRHNIALDIKPIPRNETYYLGYLVKNKIDEGIRTGDPKAREEEEKRLKIVEQGVYNQDAYLCFDHMDVYIATSMREPHEYALANFWTNEIVSSAEIKELKVRVFDPTQAYCHDRIDKGLAEALMLKRAQCTVYLRRSPTP